MNIVKKLKSSVAVLLAFMLAFTAVPMSIVAEEDAAAAARSGIAKQSAEFECDKEETGHEKNLFRSNGGDGKENERASEAAKAEQAKEKGGDQAIRMPISLEEPPAIEGKIIKHDKDSVTYQTAENTYVTRVGGEPLFYTDNDGRERMIDNNMREMFGRYENTANAYRLSLPKGDGNVRIEDEGCNVELRPVFGKLGNASVAGNAVRYNDVADGVDVQYTALSASVKEDIILMKPIDSCTFRYEISAISRDEELRYKDKDNVISIIGKKEDGSEDVKYRFAAPVMTDNSGNSSTKIRLSLSKEEGRTYLDVRADKEWLSDPGRAYPVKIDPTISLNSGNMRWGFVENGYGGGGAAGSNVSHSQNPYLYVGYEEVQEKRRD